MTLQVLKNVLRTARIHDSKFLQSPVNLQSQQRCVSIDTFKSRRKYIPRRAVMYVPGNDERKLAKIPSLGADCIVLDCEDGVAISKKEEARNKIRDILDKQSIDFKRSECTVRVNSVDSGLCSEDLKTILPAKNLPSAVHLPKVDTTEHLRWFATESFKHLPKAAEDPKSKMGLVIFIESAQAMLSLPQICQTAWDLASTTSFVPEVLVFGSDDFCADIGATRTNEASELLYARQYLVMVAKRYKLQAIDIVYIDYKDTAGLKKQSEEGARMGYTGKQIIHPGQIGPCQEAFSPSPEKIKWAKELIQGFEDHQKTGKGAFNFRGNMIDMPLVLQAKNIVEMADRMK